MAWFLRGCRFLDKSSIFFCCTLFYFIYIGLCIHMNIYRHDPYTLHNKNRSILSAPAEQTVLFSSLLFSSLPLPSLYFLQQALLFSLKAFYSDLKSPLCSGKPCVTCPSGTCFRVSQVALRDGRRETKEGGRYWWRDICGHIYGSRRERDGYGMADGRVSWVSGVIW